MAIYLSTLFMSVVEGALSCEACLNEDMAVMDALDICNYNFVKRWDDADYQVQAGENINDELRAFYEVAREYNASIPFPLRNCP